MFKFRFIHEDVEFKIILKDLYILNIPSSLEGGGREGEG